MKGFSPGLFDRLMEGSTRSAAQGAPAAVTRLSIDELKDSVARDLEALLNTRAAIGDERIRAFPECARSIITYGLKDFAGLSLSSSDDRAYICACIEKTIGRHEPRLRNVRAALVVQEGTINRLNFAITALLVLHAEQEPVNFDAVLQPSSLHYTISKARRLAQGT